MPNIEVTWNENHKLYQAVAEGFEYIVILSDTEEEARKQLKAVLEPEVKRLARRGPTRTTA